MGKIVDYLKREPVRVYIYTVLASAAGLVAAFGIVLTGAQVAALLGFAAVVLAVGGRVRAAVTSPATVEAGKFFAGRESNVTYGDVTDPPDYR